MRKLLLAILGFGALFGLAATPAGAEGIPPYPSTLPTCDAGHGAFTAFSDPSLHFTVGQPPYFGDTVLGSARGGATGDVNADYSASCNS